MCVKHSLFNLRYIWEWCHGNGKYAKAKDAGIATSRTTLSKLDKAVSDVVLEAFASHPIREQRGNFEIDESVFIKRKVGHFKFKLQLLLNSLLNCKPFLIFYA